MEPRRTHELRQLPLALAVLRVSLGGFLLVWALEKFFIPQTTVSIWQRFYFIEIGASLPYVVGAAEAGLAVAIIVGLWRRWSYGLALHAVSVASTLVCHAFRWRSHRIVSS